ncbi:MAG: hypothetical protein KF709_02600 [Gemmatimonadaceae bacterium]|nr:hypothetical protein [Gemmatimonadaceae bacterium]
MTIILQGPRARLARVPLLFRASECLDESGLYALSYGKRVAGTFTRASQKTVRDQRGRLVRVASGMPAFTVLGGQVALLLEPARTNLTRRSEAIDHAAWSKSGSPTITADAVRAPDGTLTGDLITATLDATSCFVYQAVAFTGDGIKITGYCVRKGTAGRFTIMVRDTTANVTRHQVLFTWTGGIPVPATVTGTGQAFVSERLEEDWYFCHVSAAGVIAANTNETRLYVDAPTLADTGDSLYVWGTSAEDAATPSSYMRTEGSTVTRAADALTIPYAVPPQAMSLYLRGRNVGAFVDTGASRNVLNVGSGSLGVDPRIGFQGAAASAGFQAYYDDGATAIFVGSGVPAYRDVYEARGALSVVDAATWRLTPELSINGAASTPGTSSTSGPATAWPANIVRFTPQEPNAVMQLLVALDARDMDALRSLAGVG